MSMWVCELHVSIDAIANTRIYLSKYIGIYIFFDVFFQFNKNYHIFSRQKIFELNMSMNSYRSFCLMYI